MLTWAIWKKYAFIEFFINLQLKIGGITSVLKKR